VSSRQERRQKEREELRKKRIAAQSEEQAKARKRLIMGYGAAGILVALVLAGLVIVLFNSAGGASGDAHVSSLSGSTNGVALDEREGTVPPPIGETDLAAAAEAAECVLKEDLPSEGATHLPRDAETPKYKTKPPTSGNHVEPPYQQADGAYSETPPAINVVHSLEHGRIAIQYSPDLPEEDQLALRGLYDTLYAGALLFPNPDMPYAVAATGWRNLIGCEEYKGEATLDAIRAFGIDKFGKGPEPVTGFGPLDGPNPARPENPEPAEDSKS
jgi:hypothetical protein